MISSLAFYFIYLLLLLSLAIMLSRVVMRFCTKVTKPVNPTIYGSMGR